MQIVIGKCVTGDFIIGKLEEKNNKPYLVDCYVVIVVPDQRNQQQLNSIIMPLMAPFDDKTVKEISIENFILSIVEAPEDIQRVYIKLTTGLDVVLPGIKIVQ